SRVSNKMDCLHNPLPVYTLRSEICHFSNLLSMHPEMSYYNRSRTIEHHEKPYLLTEQDSHIRYLIYSLQSEVYHLWLQVNPLDTVHSKNFQIAIQCTLLREWNNDLLNSYLLFYNYNLYLLKKSLCPICFIFK